MIKDLTIQCQTNLADELTLELYDGKCRQAMQLPEGRYIGVNVTEGNAVIIDMADALKLRDWLTSVIEMEESR